MTRIVAIVAFTLAAGYFPRLRAQTALPPATVEISAADLEDKIRGGMVGQVLGNRRD